MKALTYTAFAILGLVCLVVQYIALRLQRKPVVGNNPTFVLFQKTYFAAYFPAILADWLQGPYLYKLYSHYGFQEDQIAVLYVCGFASTVILGTWTPIAADRYGRKKLCIMFTVIYTVACMLKLSWNYGVLILARILGGVATSLLFSAFEAWYVTEHVEKNDFPKEWIDVTFYKASVWNGILAIMAGLVANVLAEWLDFGPVSPFMLAIPFLLLSGVVVLIKWDENCSKQKTEFKRPCEAGFRKIVEEPKIFLIGIIQSLFESSMYIFIFIWTPALDHPSDGLAPSLGITFSSFMVCIMIGNALFHILSIKRIPVLNLLTASIILALLANIVCAIASSGDPEHRSSKRNTVFLAFLVVEISVGMYFPAMTFIRSQLVPEATRRSILNWFRVPLNLITCIVLMMLHNPYFRHGNRFIFVTCVGLLSVAAVCTVKFITMVQNDPDVEHSDEEESENLINSSNKDVRIA